MEFLQGYFAEGPLGYEELAALLARDGVKLANLATGAYVSAEKHKALLQKEQQRVAALEEELAGLGPMAEEAAGLRAQLDEAKRDFEAQLAKRDYEAALGSAIAASGGRSERAIRALLDEDALLEAGGDMPAAIRAAIGALREAEPYLFGGADAPPPFAAGTGASAVMRDSFGECLGI